MKHFYTTEKNVQILLALLKAHGIKRIIASPGGTNITFVISAQNDSFFEMYSCVDERSAAYMAVGMAAESGDPVVLSCTGATASRNYMPALTEAYYRKLPVLVVTSSRAEQLIGHLRPQITDRSNHPSDICVEHVQVPMVENYITERLCKTQINKAILALTHNGGGPAHIDLLTLTSQDFSIEELPKVNPIVRISRLAEIPEIPTIENVVIFIGAHRPFSKEAVLEIEKFCEKYNAVVVADHTSNYYGKYAIHASLLLIQSGYNGRLREPNLVIHIGEVSGDTNSTNNFFPRSVWRVSEDGACKDLFGTLSMIFQMSESDFFGRFNNQIGNKSTEFYKQCLSDYQEILGKVPELPFSNLWVAYRIHNELPKNSVLHLGIFNSLRCWNFFTIPDNVRSESNVGGFGIDGTLSTLIGASLVNPNQLYFVILGDLSFFYDLNSLGNRHITPNIRIMLINNGLGQEFKNPRYVERYQFNDETDKYVAAKGHYAKQSQVLVQHYAEDLGFKYLSASNKNEFEERYQQFLASDSGQPMIFEIFTRSEDETDALFKVESVLQGEDEVIPVSKKIKKAIKKVFPQDKITALKTLLS